MDEFPSNSYRKKPQDEKSEPKRVERVTTSDPVVRKTPLSRKFAQTFIGGSGKGVLSYIVFEILVPAAKDMISDAVSQGAEQLLFGEARHTSRRGGRRPYSGPGGYVSYNRYSASREPQRDEPRSMSRRGRTMHDFNEIILATRVEAEEVLDRLFDILNKYQTVSVSDLYELVGITANFTDEKWGWTELRGSQVAKVRNGYLLDLPRPEPLDRA
jgi:hypothetical protein